MLRHQKEELLLPKVPLGTSRCSSNGAMPLMAPLLLLLLLLRCLRMPLL